MDEINHRPQPELEEILPSLRRTPADESQRLVLKRQRVQEWEECEIEGTRSSHISGYSTVTCDLRPKDSVDRNIPREDHRRVQSYGQIPSETMRLVAPSSFRATYGLRSPCPIRSPPPISSATSVSTKAPVCWVGSLRTPATVRERIPSSLAQLRVVSQEVVPELMPHCPRVFGVLLRELEIWEIHSAPEVFFVQNHRAEESVQVVEHERPVNGEPSPWYPYKSTKRSAIPNNVVPSGGTKYPGASAPFDSAVFRLAFPSATMFFSSTLTASRMRPTVSWSFLFRRYIGGMMKDLR
ncbi:hypothetical protein B0H14DRAFT_3540584 [Mycena olivaceomarginata]|nr:hypothetical protein B0H14DRAFT_3540584 [Mycena olivaceomarginata]